MKKTKTVKQKLRANFLWLHRWLGLISGIVVFIVSISGCLYVFEEEGRDIFQRKYFYVSATDHAERKSLHEITAVVKTQYPKDSITQIRFKEKANAAIIVHTKTEKAISVNPYTLQVIGVRNLKTDFFNWIVKFHMTLHMGELGNEIVRWNVLIFFIICITGLIIWWPKQKKFLKQVIRINFKTKNWKRLNWDLHSVLGFYSLVVLLIISLTGIFWMFDWAKKFTALATGSKQSDTKPPVNKTKTATAVYAMEDAYYKAKELYPGAAQVFISNSVDAKQPLRILFRYPYTLVRKQNTLFFDKYSGELLREDLYKNYTAYDKVMRSNFDFHTGRIRALGIGSKIIYFLASLFAASLPVTGFLIWWGRRRKTKAIGQKVEQKFVRRVEQKVEALPVSSFD
ncbi:MAG TPA: PepSY-associated TM helix domain-containing protein [Chitinophagaceae bacterium]|nr:PepSY-associated TM helix domain-containing protein [Chitinophagaceae bacterium]